MEQVKPRKTKAEVLSEIHAAHDKRQHRASELLKNIKDRRRRLEELLEVLTNVEPELVYRFYHQSFKVFWLKNGINAARAFFKEIAPDETTLNSWFIGIVDKAIDVDFDADTTNKNWLAETRPILEGHWHCKFFVEQMLSSADSLDEIPTTLPYDWAAVLYLYDLR